MSPHARYQKAAMSEEGEMICHPYFAAIPSDNCSYVIHPMTPKQSPRPVDALYKSHTRTHNKAS